MASWRMRLERPARGSADAATAVRHLRDILRSEILEGKHAEGMLPSETELMVAYDASRATVRGAFVLLRQEGIIDRLRGVGTFVVSRPSRACLAGVNLNFMIAPGATATLDDDVYPRVIEQRVVAMPSPVASRLEVPSSTPCLRFEFVSLKSAKPSTVVTNYTLFPEAERLMATCHRAEWSVYLADAKVAVGDSECLIGSVGADSGVATLLQIRTGVPVTFVQQLTFDPSGRPFNFAVMYLRSDRVLLSYRASAEQLTLPADAQRVDS